MEEKIEKIYSAVKAYDLALETYDKESSGENREAFAKAYEEANKLVKDAPMEIKYEIAQDWNTVDIATDGLRRTSNGFVRFASFGMAASGQNAMVGTIRTALLMVMKKLTVMLEKETGVSTQKTVADDAIKAVAQELFTAVEAFDKAIETFDKEGGGENREAFANAYEKANALVQNAPMEIKGEIAQDWNAVAISTDGLRRTSNGFVRFASFGMAASGQNALVGTIRSMSMMVMKKLKDML